MPRTGLSQLAHALGNRNLAVARLLARRAPSLDNNELILAARDRYEDVLRLLLAHLEGTVSGPQRYLHLQPALAVACMHAELAAVERLLEHGADPNKVGAGKEAPLLAEVAARGRQVDIATLNVLLDAGADVDIRDKRGDTPPVRRALLRVLCLGPGAAGRRCRPGINQLCRGGHFRQGSAPGRSGYRGVHPGLAQGFYD